jgi:MtN3 and saliva related transmembrane protein
MDAASVVGAVAAVMSAVSNLPQAIKTWRTRETGDLSARMLMLLTAGLALWVVYGLLRADWFVVAANACSLALVAYILSVKAREGSGPSSSAREQPR